MTRPSEEELQCALKKAAGMRDKNNDPDLVAKSLLSEHYHAECLQEVLLAADRYINLGMSESERTKLIRAIQKSKAAESYTTYT